MWQTPSCRVAALKPTCFQAVDMMRACPAECGPSADHDAGSPQGLRVSHRCPSACGGSIGGR
eukprot:10744454-Alexandrium_andersonii.AAC.1